MKISRFASLRHAAVLAAATLLTAATPHDRYAPNQWALIIGIGDYLNFGDEIGGDLPGAVNDANAFRDVAISRFGVPAENVHMVLDLAATRDRIEREFTEWLPGVVGPRDIVWIFFAGHGSQVWDENADEMDGLEETICPTDVARGSPDMDITDDEISLWLQGIPAEELVVVWDKCHAESSTRAVTPFALPRALAREPEEDLTRPVGLREARASRGLGDRIARRPVEEWRGERVPEIIEIAASQADQVAVDAAWPTEEGEDPTFGGAFTTNFVRNVWQAPTDATLEDLFERTANDLRAQRFQQRPELSGESSIRNRPIATIASRGAEGAEQDTPSQSGAVPVLAVDGDVITLGGGANTGVTVGSIYQAGTELLRVTEVTADAIRATRSKVELRGLEAVARDPLEAGAEARLVAYVYPPVGLRVSIADLPEVAQQTLVSALGGMASLQLVTELGEFAHLIVRPASSGFVVLGLDGFARHHVPAQTPEAAAVLLRPILQREVQSNELAELNNPAPSFDLEFGFDEPDNTFGLGDLLRFHVTTTRSGYLTVVDLGTDGKINVLFPNQWDSNNRMEAGSSLTLPTATMGFDFEALPPAGRGIVRAFLTERPLMLTVGQDDPNLGRAIMSALSNAVGAPPIQGSEAMPLGTWATASIAYEITP